MAVTLNNQSVIDLSIQHTGSVSAVVELCVLNDLSFDEIIAPGQTVEIPKTDYGFENVAQYFEANKIEPSTSFSEGQFVNEGGVVYPVFQDDYLTDQQKRVLENQSVFDLCSQYHGTAAAAIEMMVLNGFSIDEFMIPGQIVKIESKDYGFGENVATYISKKIQPATAFREFTDWSLPGEFPYSF